MAIANTDIKYFFSGNGTAAGSLGGAITATAATSGIFDNVSSAEASAGDTEYRCVYVKNDHGTLTLTAAKVWLQSNTPSTFTEATIALGSSAVNGVEQTIADESTAPTGLAAFDLAASEGAALSIGDIPAGQHKAIWLKRVVSANATAYTNDGFTIRVKGDTAA